MDKDDDIRWLANNIISWEKAPRPDREKIELYIKGFFGGVGTIEQKENSYIVTLPGTPAYLHIGYGWVTQEPYHTRWIEVLLVDENSVVVRSPVQDKFTQRLAAALTETFYYVQSNQDQKMEESE